MIRNYSLRQLLTQKLVSFSMNRGVEASAAFLAFSLQANQREIGHKTVKWRQYIDGLRK